ncbi:hypothetical protein HGRIS_006727 [Hohenbuehelia grisea]|uniref:Cyanovirin-N domain-containing protein n=1 Tax=Hohenbuehelia grisea TaxID=104357 RepID=A0ABR3J9W1_9AGAR
MLVSFSFALTLIASVTAAVIEVREPALLEKRQVLTVIMCKDLNLQPGSTGGCTSVTTANGGCYADLRLLSQDGGNWNDKVTSAAVASEVNDRSFSCYLFADLNCTGRSLRINFNEAIRDLRTRGFDDITTSVKCQYN